MTFETRETVVRFVERDYFGSAAQSDVSSMLDCFHNNAQVLIRHGDNPTRYFSPQPSEAHSDLTDFFSHLCGTFEPRFSDFQHFIDIEKNCSACYFRVLLTPRSPAMLKKVGVQELNNCNFFHYSDRKIQNMIIYYSNAAALGRDIPTGYPKGND